MRDSFRLPAAITATAALGLLTGCADSASPTLSGIYPPGTIRVANLSDQYLQFVIETDDGQRRCGTYAIRAARAEVLRPCVSSARLRMSDGQNGVVEITVREGSGYVIRVNDGRYVVLPEI